MAGPLLQLKRTENVMGMVGWERRKKNGYAEEGGWLALVSLGIDQTQRRRPDKASWLAGLPLSLLHIHLIWKEAAYLPTYQPA